MTLERITKNNIDYAIQIQEEFYPEESGRANFEESLDEKSGYNPFLKSNTFHVFEFGQKDVMNLARGNRPPVKTLNTALFW